MGRVRDEEGHHFECRLIEALSSIETLKDNVMTLKEGTEARGSTSPDPDREARFWDP